MRTKPTTVRTIDLGYEQVLLIDGGPGTRIRVLYGAMWLTEEGVADDAFARAGDEVALRGHGTAVIEAIGAGRVQVHTPLVGGRLARALAWLGREPAAALRRWRSAMQFGPAAAGLEPDVSPACAARR